MSKSPSLASPDLKGWLLPAAIFFLAFSIRLIGIGWGLPNELHNQSYHPDEGQIWCESQAIQPTQLKFTPGFYNYGTLYLTTLKVTSDVVAGYSGSGLDPQKPDSAWSYIARCQLAGRVISALAGSGMALFVYLILMRLTTRFGAVLGGAMIAIAPGHVVHSRFQTVDIAAAFLLTVGTYFALRLIRSDNEKHSDIKLAVLSGLFFGLSAGTKYTGILGLLTLFTIVLAVHKTNGIKLCIVGLGSALIAFVLTTPGFVLDSSAFLRDFLYEMSHTSQGHGIIFEGTSSGFIYQFSNLMLGIGLILTLLGLTGLGLGAWRKYLWALGLLAFFVPYYILIGRAEVKFLRYTFPLYIALGVGFGWLMGQARAKGGNWHGLVGLGLLGLGGFLGGGLQSTGRYTVWMLQPDPRESAGKYLAGKDVSVGLVTDPWFYTASFHPDLGQRMIYRAGMPFVGYANYDPFDAATQAMTGPKVERYVPLDSQSARSLKDRVESWDTRLLTESKPDYVVYSSFETENLENLERVSGASQAAHDTVLRWKDFGARLNQDYAIDRIFSPTPELVHDMMYIQPTIWVWKRK